MEAAMKIERFEDVDSEARLLVGDIYKLLAG